MWLGLCLLAAPLAAAPKPDTVVVLVRHAEKVADGSRDPLLTKAGARRAQALVDRVSGLPIAAVYATPFRRTQLTGWPVAKARGLAVIVRPAGEPATSFAEVLRTRHAGQQVLVVGHSNTLPALARALGAQGVADMDESEYDRTMIVVIPAQGEVRVRQERWPVP
jgi:broad specificity phosphatase PhoE